MVGSVIGGEGAVGSGGACWAQTLAGKAQATYTDAGIELRCDPFDCFALLLVGWLATGEMLHNVGFKAWPFDSRALAAVQRAGEDRVSCEFCR